MSPTVTDIVNELEKEDSSLFNAILGILGISAGLNVIGLAVLIVIGLKLKQSKAKKDVQTKSTLDKSLELREPQRADLKKIIEMIDREEYEPLDFVDAKNKSEESTVLHDIADSQLAKLEEWVRNGRLSPNDLNQVKDQNELTALDIVRDKNPDLVQRWYQEYEIYSKI